jgi:hypothetical protein
MTDAIAPSKADYTKYKAILPQIHEDIRLIGKSLKRLGQNLKKIRDGRLYLCGSYSSFQDFCQAELGKGRQYVYKLIQAYDTLQLLSEGGIEEKDLPSSERLVRELRQLSEYDQVPVWKEVMRRKRGTGQAPTIHDVRIEVANVIKSDKAIDEAIEREQAELTGRFEEVSRTLKVGVKFDLLTPRYRRRLTAVLDDIAATVQILISSLRSAAIDEEE